MPDWKKIKAEYIKGNTTYAKLAEKYSVSSSTLRKKASKEKWTDLRNKAGKKRDSLLAEAVGTKEAKKAKRIKDAADMLLARIEDMLEDRKTKLKTKNILELTNSLKNMISVMNTYPELDHQEQEARISKLRTETSLINGPDDKEAVGVLIMPKIKTAEKSGNDG